MEENVEPEGATWVAAVYSSAGEYAPLGGGVVIDEWRVLTCAHVVEGVAGPWVAFPNMGDEEEDSEQRFPVTEAVFPSDGVRGPRGERVKDLAVLHLSERIPAGVVAAPLQSVRPEDLVGKRWWALGFPDRNPIGNTADGTVGSVAGHSWVRIDSASRYQVKPGFSGSGVWSPDYQAVVALVGQAGGEMGDGLALTFFRAEGWLPGEKIGVSVASPQLIPVITDQGSARGQVTGGGNEVSVVQGQDSAGDTSAGPPPDRQAVPGPKVRSKVFIEQIADGGSVTQVTADPGPGDYETDATIGVVGPQAQYTAVDLRKKN